MAGINIPTVLIALIIFIFNACQAPIQSATLPTLMSLPDPTDTPIPAATVTPALVATQSTPVAGQSIFTPEPSNTPSTIASPTVTPSATITDTPTVTSTATPVGDALVIGEKGTNLREGPSTRFSPPLALLEPRTPLRLTGRTADSRWYEAQTFDNQAGWVFSDLIEVYIDISALPITYVEIPTAVPLIVGAPNSNDIAHISGTVSPRVRQIYQDGLRRGNQPLVFSKVGDSITANQPFFGPFAAGKYDLGSYAYLQESIEIFDPSMRRASLAAANAFNAAAVVSDLWADQNQCEPSETPLECEYRLNRPSIAIIMLGSVDMQIYTAEEYETYMVEIVQTTIDSGIVPVLTTFPNQPDFFWEESVEFNNILREIARREQIPLIELREPALNLPNSGVEEDKFHLSRPDHEFMVLNEDEFQYATTLRDLLTMQMLDTIRRGVQ